ncbi:hypothetical protein ACWIGM_26660 [Bosea sp. NPDC055332]
MTISNPLLDFAVGMIAFFLVASLIVTALQETIAQRLDLRAKDLRKKIDEMLKAGGGGSVATKDFFDHPLVAALNTRGDKGGPSYIPRDVFTKAVKDLYLAGHAGQAAIAAAKGLGNDGSQVKRALRLLAEQASDDLEAFDKAIGDWFDGVMDRLSGLYKRRVQWILFLLGFGVAALGNLDALKVGAFLAGEPEARAALAENLQGHQERLKQTSLEDREKREALRGEMVKELERARVPIGWSAAVAPKPELMALVVAVMGWLLTALAAIIGAPFWFDTLKRFVNIRAAGPVGKGSS